MLNKKTAKKVLDTCLETGADFADIFFESTTKNSIVMMDGHVEDVSTKLIYGAGIRILKEKQQVYGYTNDVSLEGLLDLANRLNKTYNSKPLGIKFSLKELKYVNKNPLDKLSKDIPNSEKISLVKTVSDAMLNYDERIIQGVASLSESTQEVYIANTLGVYATDTRNIVRLGGRAIAKDKNGMQSSGENFGGNMSISAYKEYDLKGMAEEACKSAITMLDAPEMKGGTYDVVMHNGFGGVLFHEACGHSLEATSVAKGQSVFTGKMGEKIASSVVTAIDDGSVPNAWGSSNIDDEGTPTQKNVLIENGVLKSYMWDFADQRRMEHPLTGSSRRESYKYSPTSRMTNTYIDNGESTFEEIIENTKFGLFARKMGGGSVNPVTGEFNFTVSEGYMIEDGKITTPVRGAALIGNGKDTLFNIDMVGNNRSFGHGVCGSASGSIPANVGQPTIRIKNMTVGGGRK